MATNPKILKLIQSLIRATASGRLEWSALRGPNDFDLPLKQGGITISSDGMGKSEEYYVGLREEKGRVIESEFFEEGDEGFEEARSLFLMVKRSALQVDNFIDSVISDIEKTN
jgi:hypothetical protein